MPAPEPAGSPTDIAFAPLLQRERLTLLAWGCRVAGLGGTAAVGVAAAGLLQVAPAAWVLLWVCTILPLVLANFWFMRVMRRAAQDMTPPARLEAWFALRAGITGLLWGASAWLAGDGHNGAALALTATLLMSVTIANAGALALSRVSFMAFACCTLVPLAAMLLPTPPAAMPLAGWGVLVYLLVVIALNDSLGRTLGATLRRRLESEAVAREQQVIFDAAAEAIVLEREGHVVKCNRRFLDLMRASEREALGSPMWVWHHDPDEWPRHSAAAAQQGDRPYRYTATLRRRDGTGFPAELTGMAVDPARPAAGHVWMGSDLSERRGAEAALRQSEARFRRLISMSSDLYWEQDAELRFTHLSGSGMARAGHQLEQCLGKRRWEIPGIEGVTPEQWTRHRAQLDAREPFRDFVFYLTGPDNQRLWFSTSGNPMCDDSGAFAGYHGVATDITERMRHAERFRHLAYHDPLTGLPNRRLLADRIEQAIGQARRRDGRVALMVLDLDGFKIINDSDGHAVGDAVLATIAHRLRLAVRDSDTVARVGGDEFVVLLPDADAPQAADAVADKLLDAVRHPITSDLRDYVLGVSIGMAFFPDHADTGEALMQRADAAMYRAKQQGGRRTVGAASA